MRPPPRQASPRQESLPPLAEEDLESERVPASIQPQSDQIDHPGLREIIGQHSPFLPIAAALGPPSCNQTTNGEANNNNYLNASGWCAQHF